jgi:SAM-dependent methyltransferase
LSRALAFLDDGRPLDYGRRFSRLRWQRAAGVERSETWKETASAGEFLRGADEWMLVLDADALPASRTVPAAPEGSAFASVWARPEEAVHTLRELERARLAPLPPAPETGPAALLFRTGDAAGLDISVKELIRRLQSTAASSGACSAVGFEVASERERPELTRRLPDGPLAILDAGCGAGAGIAGARARRPEWRVTGVERDPELAGRARARCDRVFEGDLRTILPALEKDGERFDAVVFADVLEHLEDPIAALSAARRIARPGARLVVSVPNAGHLSIVRDLICGRFDPVPAGLCDAHHLRWFTRGSLARAIEEAGWRLNAVEAEAGAAPPSPEEVLALAASWPEADRESLMTYQWVATGEA